MIRTKRGPIARKRKTKSGALTRTISQQRIKALFSSQRDRDRKKRDFRSLWISRINPIIYYSNLIDYRTLMYNLYKNQLLLNRKIVAQIGILKINFLFTIANDLINQNSPETENSGKVVE